MNRDKISYYHSLLDGPVAKDAIDKLLEGTRLHKLDFGSRPICTVLRPMLISAAQYDYIKRDSELVLSAIDKIGDALVADDKLRAELDLTQKEEEIVSIDPGFRAPDASGRLDAFLNSAGDFNFVEYNADSPGGLLYGDVLGEVFAEMDVIRKFSGRFPLRRVQIRPRILKTLLACYREWGNFNTRERPKMAIVDWDEVKTRSEFEICREYFESQGYSTIIADPRELEYRGGWLRAGNFKIDLVYKRVITGELLERGGLNHPLIRAVRERAVCAVNSFRVQMLYRKAVFALLDDPAYEYLFQRDEIDALRRHIPWTRQLKNKFTNYRGRRVDLIDFVSSHRSTLVIKPSGDYGGRGVRMGWECSEDDWQRAIKDAIGASFVVQERVEVLQENFPVLVDRDIRYEDRYVDFDPYTWRGSEVEGAGVRLSSSTLLNVSAGGGSATPLFIFD